LKTVFYENENINEEVIKQWKSFYDRLDNIHQFQSIEWQLLALKKYRLTFLNRLALKVVVSISYKSNGEIYAIFPFVIRRKKGYICGDMAGGDYVDFLYTKDFKSEDLSHLLNEIKRKYNLKKLYFRGIRTDSNSNHLIRGLANKKFLKETKCVGINIEKTYEEFLKKLKKSVRQNLRTANNRLKTDNKEAYFEIYHNEKIDRHLVSDLQKVYYSRIQSRYTNFKAYLVKLIKSLLNLYYINKYNVVFDYMENNANHLLAVYKIDSKIAAYCYGPASHDAVSIIQVSINEEFYKYSPGKLLITHLVDYLISERNASKGINYLDLTIGDENYKYELGGIEKIRSDYIVEL
jgi:CelD/BcsL family acetyltransferase involved in cellulose biosynthesis